MTQTCASAYTYVNSTHTHTHPCMHMHMYVSMLIHTYIISRDALEFSAAAVAAANNCVNNSIIAYLKCECAMHIFAVNIKDYN